MESVSYGSDNPDCIKVDAALSPTTARSSSKRWKTLVLIATGTALCIGSALATYQGWNSVAATLASAPNGMFLESQYTSEVKPDVTLLTTGQEIMLRVRGKNNLCGDDGGGWTPATSKFTNKPCNPSSPNQIFKYIPSTKQFASVYKTGLCIDDGGSTAAAGSKAQLNKCDSNSQNQWFVMNTKMLMLKNRSRTTFVSTTEHFEVMSRAAMAAEKKQKAGTTMYDLMVSGQEIMFRVRGKDNLCVDDGGSFNAATTKFVDMPCNPNSVNQVFKYNIKTGGLESVNKPGLCIDDGGALSAATTMSRLWYCDINNQNQWFDMDESTLMLKNPVKDNLCLDDGGATRAAMLEEKKKTGPTPYDMLLSGQEVMFRVRGKNNLCVDDGGGWGAAVSTFVDKPCNPNSPNQVFKYNIRTLEFENVNKPGLCIDDGGSLSAAGSTARLGYCDANNQNQWYVLDESTLMLRNPMKGNLCFDDGGGATAGASKFVMRSCDNNSPNQHFEILSRPAMLEEKKKSLGTTAYDVLTSGQEIMLRIRGKSNLCVDDGGGWSAGATNFVGQLCDPDSPNQIFKYNLQTREFENVNKPGLCIDDGGSWKAGGSQAHLWYCDPNNQNQWLVLDEDTLMLHNPMKPNLCLDDGGGTFPGGTNFVLSNCGDDSPNQHFEILSRTDFVEARRKKRIDAGIDDDINLLNSGQKLMLRVRGKNNLCVDDGGGRSNGATKFVDRTCNPSSPNQVFTYDAKTHQFKSVNKPGLCMDDGGSLGSGSVQAQLWECDPNNRNQWFVLDEENMMLRNLV
ncbi:hypothetical protein PF004_g1821 [Phytophthora fragariae]|uniref:Ricin B lectin domain-containing protein n=2 Tax=Phytophthora fragariae TaxID=53985 RepID=A0A6G0PR40_9STRA|nr:hypothetical protein PF004_g1821 [Phytophthora fragariae]